METGGDIKTFMSVLTAQLLKSTRHRPFKDHSAFEAILGVLQKLNVHHSVHKSSPVVCILIRLNPVYTLHLFQDPIWYYPSIYAYLFQVFSFHPNFSTKILFASLTRRDSFYKCYDLSTLIGSIAWAHRPQDGPGASALLVRYNRTPSVKSVPRFVCLLVT